MVWNKSATRRKRKAYTKSRTAVSALTSSSPSTARAYSRARINAMGDGHSYSAAYTVNPAVLAYSTGENMGALEFKMSEIEDAGTLGTIFDMYKINLVEVQIRAQTQKSECLAVPSSSYFVGAVDYDDVNPESTVQRVLNYTNSKIIMPGESYTYRFKPRVASLVYNGLVASGYANNSSPWIDFASPSVVHYGFKYGIGQCPTDSVPAWGIFVRIYYSVRGRR